LQLVQLVGQQQRGEQQRARFRLADRLAAAELAVDRCGRALDVRFLAGRAGDGVVAPPMLTVTLLMRRAIRSAVELGQRRAGFAAQASYLRPVRHRRRRRAGCLRGLYPAAARFDPGQRLRDAIPAMVAV
jgi:hypothetical protein